jgi:hypothetical protein
MSKLALTALLAAAGIAGAAQALPADKPAPTRSCFFVSEWNGWSAPDSQTLLLKVNRDVYRLTLNGRNSSLNAPGMHLISEVRGSSSICSARDLDLSISDGTTFREYLFPASLTKLTPEEVAALPRKDLP